MNDFRKICGFEAYSPVDNVSELTARINDEGWDSTFVRVAKGRTSADGRAPRLLGRRRRPELGVSANLVRALELAATAMPSIFGVVGRDGGFTAKVADACVVIPPLFADQSHRTPKACARSSGTSWSATPRSRRT